MRPGRVLGHDRVCCAIPGFRHERQAGCHVGGAADPAFAPEDVVFCRGLFRDL
jgi:hypothetical protein